MDILEFISSLVWPALVMVMFLVLRPTIVAAMVGAPKSATAGSVDFEWARALARLRRDLHLPGDDYETRGSEAVAYPAYMARSVEPLHLSDLLPLAHIDPGSAVVESFNRVEQTLGVLVEDEAPGLSRGLSGLVLGYVAHNRGLIDSETLSIVEGLATIRNLAAHGYVPDAGRHQALEYIGLADSALNELRRTPRLRPFVTAPRRASGPHRVAA